MNMTFLGMLVSAGISIITIIFKWKLGQAKKDRIRREAAEREATTMRDGISDQHRENLKHEKKIIEIASGVSDARASELLSEPIDEPTLSGSEKP